MVKIDFLKFQQDCITNGTQALIESIKILLYKLDSAIFDRVNFDDDRIYKDPLLFAYLYTQQTDKKVLEIILYNYINSNHRPVSFDAISDEFGRIYLPNIGWVNAISKNTVYKIKIDAEKKIFLTQNNLTVNYKFESPTFCGTSSIEILKYSIPLLKQFYYDYEKNIVEVEIEEITKKNQKNLEIAFSLIEKYIPNHFELIKMVTTKFVIFNINPNFRNSFAISLAQGIGFFNAYQENYNEVHFIDDIAHQTGHVIFNALIYKSDDFFKVSPNTVIQIIQGENGSMDREIYILFHALYTYYTTFICLDACLDANVFDDLKKHETLGRMKFYISKCKTDLFLLERPSKNISRVNELFTDKGQIIYHEIKETFQWILDKWGQAVKDFDIDNQPYNFTFENFLQKNPL